MKHMNTQTLLWLALVLAMAGSLKHLAAIFASIDGSGWFGWLQAVAIDAGLFALAYSVKQRRADKRGTWFVWFGVVMFSLVSVYGNYAYGLLSTTGQLPAWIVSTMPLVLAASLPLLVIYLAEVVSDNRQHAVRVEAKEARRLDKMTKSSAFVPGDLSALSVANDTKRTEAADRKHQARTLAAEGVSRDDIAAALDVSTRTVKRYLNGQAT